MRRDTVNIPYPVISTDGKPTHVILPIEQYMNLFGDGEDIAPAGWTMIPQDVSRKVIEDISPLRAWREHKRMTQQTMAKLMGVSRPAYTQMEQAENPRRETLEKAAQALGIDFAQLIELYDDELVSTPGGMVMP